MAATTPYLPPVPRYPVHVDADEQPAPSRWLWLVKWLLAIPHYIVLAFLWVAFVLLSAVALVAIVATGRYPRAIFDFNVGVLRWTWRVAYYSYGALATDRYPPFSLAEEPDYPARLSVEYPEHLSRGLALVKWWLLAIPHYLVVGVFVGGGAAAWTVESGDGTRWEWGGGLIGILVLVAAVVLAVTGAYPRPVYDLLLGLHRWALRVAAYAGLMTDQYPPFRLDQGPHDPDGALVVPTRPASGPASATTSTSTPRSAGGPPPAARTVGWTAGPVLTVVAGSVIALLSLGLLVSGAGALLVDRAARDSAGYLGWGTDRVASDGHAVVVGDVLVEAPAAASALPERLVGDVKVTVAPLAPTTTVFVGIAPDRDVDAYLDGVSYTVPRGDGAPDREVAGSVEPAAPTSEGFWVSRAAGSGEQELVWTPRDGRWAAVVMNADGSAGVAAEVSVGATVPWLDELGWGLLLGGLGIGALAAVLIGLAIRWASRSAGS